MMRKLFFTTTIILFSTICNAQIRDLANLSKGEFTAFRTLYKDNQVFGYFVLYDLGKMSDTSKKFEYVILDKNLNKTNNKEFEAEKSVETYSIYMNFKSEIVLNPRVGYLFNYNKQIFPKSKRIIIKTNEILNKEKQCYENSIFTDCPDDKTWKEQKKNNKAERKAKGFVYESSVTELKYGGYFVSDYEDYDDYSKNNNLIRFDDNKKELWRLTYNQNATKKKYDYYRALNLDSNYIYFLNGSIEKKEKKFKIVIIDLNSGKTVKEHEITEVNKESVENMQLISNYASFSNEEDFDDKYVSSAILKNENNTNLGYFRILIDKKTLEIKINTISWENDMSKFIEVDKNGGVEKGYNLEIRDVLFFNNGSITFVTEKYKLGFDILAYSLVPKNTDIVLIHTDKDFKVKEVKILEKEKSKYNYSDYLFHQYLNNKKDMVFYYNDYQKDENKDKNWNLFINTIIDGKFNQEKIQISSKKDKYVIYPYSAKDGYILLFEYNAKDKYNQIRLEKLNY